MNHSTTRRLGQALLLTFLGVVLLTGCGPRRPLPALAEGAVVVAFGDSLTFGTGAEPGEDYPGVLGGLSGWTVVNAGIPGERTAAGLERLPGVLEEHRPALVILCHGGNDILADDDPAAIAQRLGRMIELIREQGAAVVLVGVPQKGLFLQCAPFYEEVADRYALPFEGRIVPRLLGKSSLKSDYIHPNARGYRLLAERLRELIREHQP